MGEFSRHWEGSCLTDTAIGLVALVGMSPVDVSGPKALRILKAVLLAGFAWDTHLSHLILGNDYS